MSWRMFAAAAGLACALASLSAQTTRPVTFAWDVDATDTGVSAEVERNGVAVPCPSVERPTPTVRRCTVSMPTGAGSFRVRMANADPAWGPWSAVLEDTVPPLTSGSPPGPFVIGWHAALTPGGPRMPFLGDTTQGGDSFPNSGDRALLSSFVAAEDGTVIGWQAYFDATSTAGSNVKFLLFDDNAGAPGNLIAASSGVAVPAGGGLVSGALSGAITNGATYWLGIVCDSFQSRLSEDVGIGAYVRREGFSYASPPSTWPGTDASGAVQMNVAVEYVVAGGGGPRVLGGAIAGLRRNRKAG